MSLEVIYVVRHGFRSAWSVDHLTGIYTPHIRSPTGLPTDPALTSHGVEQAGELAEHLLSLDPLIDQVYSSPYYRCLQTISPFVSRYNSTRNKALASEEVAHPQLSIRVESGLSEWYGQAHFEHPTSAPLDDLSTMFADLDANYVSCFAPRRRGESIPQLYERVASCVQDIIAKCDQEGKKAVVICTHAAVVIALGRILTGKIPEDVSVADFNAFTCGLSMYRRQAVRENHNSTATIDGPPVIRNRAANSPDARNAMQAAAIPSTPGTHGTDHPGGPGGPGLKHLPQGYSFDVASHWTCEADSDCSFLRGGAERGWNFSGDESFIEAGQNGPPQSTVERRPDVVEGDGDSLSNASTPKL
ncbi:RNA polymerase III transcription initiation factor complex component [Xylaria sp. CBS 124048]|nr:RNA polymerase III transcription initiation factor complex component [Xylaria sp. CBS 124048]